MAASLRKCLALPEPACCSNSVSHSNKLCSPLTWSHVWKFLSSPHLKSSVQPGPTADPTRHGGLRAPAVPRLRPSPGPQKVPCPWPPGPTAHPPAWDGPRGGGGPWVLKSLRLLGACECVQSKRTGCREKTLLELLLCARLQLVWVVGSGEVGFQKKGGVGREGGSTPWGRVKQGKKVV